MMKGIRLSRREILGYGSFLAAATLAAACAPAGAPSPAAPATPAAPAFPTRPVLIVVPFAAGGGTDVMARNVQRVIEEGKLLNVSITIENRTGGDGAAGTTYGLSRPADGHTLIGFGNSQLALPFTGDVPWTIDDIVFVARLVSDVNMLIVRADSPFKTLAELVDYAKKNPKALKIGGTGSAPFSTDVVAQRDFSRATGTETTYVPFSGGGEVMTNLLGGHVDAAWANPNECIGQLEAKQVRALGVTDTKRLDLLPDIPTMKEQGWEVLNDQWRGLVARKGTPDYAIKFWEETLNKVRKSPLWVEGYLKKNVLQDGWLGHKEFTEAARQEYERLLKAAQELGIKR
jgi:putative tricarboxylic transport membrane protein